MMQGNGSNHLQMINGFGKQTKSAINVQLFADEDGKRFRQFEFANPNFDGDLPKAGNTQMDCMRWIFNRCNR